MGPKGPLEFQAPLEMMDYLVFQAQKAPEGCLASQVSQEREGNLVPEDILAGKEKLERRVVLASWETLETQVTKELKDSVERKEKWLLFPERGSLENLAPQEMMDSQEQKVIKGTPGYQGEEESQEDPDPLEFIKGNPAERGSRVFLDPQALQAHLG